MNSQFRLLALLAALGVVALISVARPPRAMTVRAHDFAQYWLAVQAARMPEIRDVYESPQSHAARRRLAVRPDAGPGWLGAMGLWRWDMHLVNTPLLHAALSPLMRDGFAEDLRRFRRASLAAFHVGAFMAGFALGAPIAVVALIQGMALLSGPYHLDVIIGNVNQLQVGLLGLLMVAVAFSARHPGGTAAVGFFAAALVFFKPNVAAAAVVLPAWWGVRREWARAGLFLVGMVAGGVLAWLVPDIVLAGRCRWPSWGLNLMRLVPNWSNPTGFADRLPWPSPWLTRAVVLFFLSILLVRRAWAFRGCSLAVGDRRRIEMGFAAFAPLPYVLLAQHAFNHYFLLLMPLALYVASAARTNGRRVAALAAWAVICWQKKGGEWMLLNYVAAGGLGFLAMEDGAGKSMCQGSESN